MLKFDDANDLLLCEFEELRESFVEGDYCKDTTHCFYNGEFVPYIVKQIKKGNKEKLEKALLFVEKLLREGDGDHADGIINLAAVSIVEPLYYEDGYEGFKDTLFSMCGELTRKSFEEMDADE